MVSDWEGVDRIGTDYKNNVKLAINAGVDMVMVPYNFQRFISDLTDLVLSGQVTMSRIEDAVRRILRVKFVTGLFERPMADRSLAGMLGHPVSEIYPTHRLRFPQGRPNGPSPESRPIGGSHGKP